MTYPVQIRFPIKCWDCYPFGGPKGRGPWIQCAPVFEGRRPGPDGGPDTQHWTMRGECGECGRVYEFSVVVTPIVEAVSQLRKETERVGKAAESLKTGSATPLGPEAIKNQPNGAPHTDSEGPDRVKIREAIELGLEKMAEAGRELRKLEQIDPAELMRPLR